MKRFESFLTTWWSWGVVTFGWGLAEGTLFFVVPDVWISLVSMQSLRRGLWSTGFALLGSLVGAGLILALTSSEFESVLLLIPGVSSEQIARAGSDLSMGGARQVLLGPLLGIPNKIYSWHVGQLGVEVVPYLMFSAVSRWLRFALVATGAGLIGRWMGAKNTWRYVVWVGFWALVYTSYLFYKI